MMYTVVFQTLTGGGAFSFETKCKTLEEAKTVLNAIADFSNYEIDNKMKPDYSSMVRIEDEEGNELEEEDEE